MLKICQKPRFAFKLTARPVIIGPTGLFQRDDCVYALAMVGTPRQNALSCAMLHSPFMPAPRAQMPDEPPPFLGTWPRVYAAVLIYLATLIVLFYCFTRFFS